MNMLLFTVKNKIVGVKALDVYNDRMEIFTKTRNSKHGTIIVPFEEVATAKNQEKLLNIVARLATKQIIEIKNNTFENEDIVDICGLIGYISIHSEIPMDSETGFNTSNLGQISLLNPQKLVLTGYEKRISIEEKRYALELFIKRERVNGTQVDEWYEYPALKERSEVITTNSI